MAGAESAKGAVGIARAGLLIIVLILVIVLAALLALASAERGGAVLGGAAPDGAATRRFPATIIAQSRRTPTSVDYGLLRTTAEGLYSTILPAYTGPMAELIRRWCPSARGDYRAYDATANIGGDTLNILHNFPRAHVTASEVNPANFRALETNLRAAGVQNRCRAILGNCLDVVGTLDTQDFVFVDPPWGGPDVWKAGTSIPLYLGGTDGSPVRVEKFIESALEVAAAVLLKAPPNFDDGPITAKYDVARETIHKPRRRGATRRREVAYVMHYIRARAG